MQGERNFAGGLAESARTTTTSVQPQRRRERIVQGGLRVAESNDVSGSRR